MDTAICSDRNLGRIVSLLAALAVLAERAAGRSLPVRWLLLAILRRAEHAARAFVAEATLCEWPGLGEPEHLRYDQADAIQVAERFRALAALLAALLPATGLLANGSGVTGSVPGRFTPRAGRLADAPSGRAGRPNDTS